VIGALILHWRALHLFAPDGIKGTLRLARIRSGKQRSSIPLWRGLTTLPFETTVRCHAREEDKKVGRRGKD